MESNKLIAEFMGAVGTPKYNPTEWDVYITGCLDVDSDDEKAQHFYTPDEMKYHKEWNWLMPVVEKIEGMPYMVDEVNICYDSVSDENKYSCEITNAQKFTFEIIRRYAPTRLEATYEALVEFIKWYNQKKED